MTPRKSNLDTLLDWLLPTRNTVSSVKDTMNLATTFLALGISSLAVAHGDSITASTYKGFTGLHDMAKASGKYMGTAVDQDMKDPAALKVLKNTKDFGMLTSANAMKVLGCCACVAMESSSNFLHVVVRHPQWDATESTQNTFKFENADAFVTLAKEMGAQVRCHTLLWVRLACSFGTSVLGLTLFRWAHSIRRRLSGSRVSARRRC
jgi:hypothetical protein